ncbi:MAG: 1-deoxy-D-xylulose-5-phosphate reductoisomerase [Actinobacteria bacterium]|nr:1-deoxy-D-xylulose-5-phosphate reductoisomerase [Actinomycetota bacterium]
MLNNWSVPIRRVSILGSTGSIGTQGLEVIDQHRDKFKVVGLSAGSNVSVLNDQINKFKPEVVSVKDEEAKKKLLETNFDYKFEILAGKNASAEVAKYPCDVVLNGITGAAGLLPTLETLKAGHKLALANKESLVIGGKLVLDLAQEGQIIPVDSEHSALAQCLRGEKKSEIKKLILTASGGPFRGKSTEELKNVTVEQTLNHPTWNMGPVVTINSASLMNKGLEIIEAHLLFGIEFEKIDVVVHPQSIIHSMIEFIDGSTMAQASPPNMKLPIALGLSWPDRLMNVQNPIEWTKSQSWTFENVDDKVFKAINLAKKVGKAAGSAPAAMNAANEECVSAFIERKISFLSIVEIVEQVVENHLSGSIFVNNQKLTLEELLNIDELIRIESRKQINNLRKD